MRDNKPVPPRMTRFEFRIFPADQFGQMDSAKDSIEFHDLADINAARRKAGQLAKQHNGPVDLAYEDACEWNDRYVTTAMPSPYHAAKYRFERLDS